MRPYGLTVGEYDNDSKKAGDLFTNFGRTGKSYCFSSTGTKNALRCYKKTARQNNKKELKDYE